MSVVCPICGATSADLEFCDRCNADLQRPQTPLPPPVCPLPGGSVELSADQRALLARAEHSVLLPAGSQCWRVYWLPAGSALDSAALHARQRWALACLPPCRLVEGPQGIWLLAEARGTLAEPWSQTKSADPIADLRHLLVWVCGLAASLTELHENGLVWLSFDPAALEVIGQSADGHPILRLTNLDLRVYCQGACPEPLPVRPPFAAPEACGFRPQDIGPRTDVFHLALFCYYWLAGLLPHGFSGRGPEAFQFRFPNVRILNPGLPPGIARVLRRGLAVDPARRFGGVRSFCTALTEAIERAAQRWSYQGPVAWEIGSHSRTGRAKAANGQANEDRVLVRHLENPNRVLAVVADGITTCDVGSGALASLVVTINLEKAFSDQCSLDRFEATITQACSHCSRTLLDWALEKGYGGQLAQGRDLMGTTVTVAWLEGNQMGLANVGDSRAYLVTDNAVEQLTVDGDLGSGLLAAGTPPEQIQEMGLLAKALRQCIGGCTVIPGGKVGVYEETCQPSLSRWPLLPGDVVVLCSDGLVEEGVFLEPEHLKDIIRSNKDFPAQELALQLAEAADALQRLPSNLEPEGFGDNISCIVIKIKGA